MAEEEETPSKKKVTKGSYELVEVPTQTTWVFQDSEGNYLDEKQALLQLLNDVALLKKATL